MGIPLSSRYVEHLFDILLGDCDRLGLESVEVGVVNVALV